MINNHCSNTQKIIEKWYHKLLFPSAFDKEFYCALEKIKIPEDTVIETYDLKESDGKRNLLAFLYMCERLETQYKKQGIDETVLLDTLGDLVRWTETWSELKHELYLGQLSWVSIPMKMQIFKLGRLQFCMQKIDHDIPEYGISKGDDIIGIHIPAGEAMTQEACVSSIEQARSFFEIHYPEYKYSYFTCHSWLLDTSLSQFLSKESNILKFQNLFHIVALDKSDAIIRYVFRWMAERSDLEHLQPTSSFSKRVRDHMLAGGDFYEGLGIIPKNKEIFIREGS